MRIGIDFDNTLVRYDALFERVARDEHLVSPNFSGGKADVRNAVRALPNGELCWQKLQSIVYGSRIEEAVPFAGAIEFLRAARARSADVVVVSHKTQHATADPGGVDLVAAARQWLGTHVEPGLISDAYFEPTRGKKISRIRALGCTHFIDDLLEVFEDATFPVDVAQWLFVQNWDELRDRFEDEVERWRSIAELARGEADRLRLCRGGGNNRVYFVAMNDGRRFALKEYGANDERGRQRKEFGGLSFLWNHGLRRIIPQPIASAANQGRALYEWIDGERIGTPSMHDIREAASAIKEIHSYAGRDDARDLEDAADATCVPASLWEQITARIARFETIEDARLSAYLREVRMLSERLRKKVRAHRDIDARLPYDLLTLSPSDFGFHNALRRSSGICFLDFEYFGWDDPVKLVSDFLFHPGMSLTVADKKEWLQATGALFSRDPDFDRRFTELHPVIALKWCLILINEFLPEAWARRVSAGRDEPWEQAKARQLEKGTQLLNMISGGTLLHDIDNAI